MPAPPSSLEAEFEFPLIEARSLYICSNLHEFAIYSFTSVVILGRAHHEHKVNGFRQMGINLDRPASIIFQAQSNIPSTTENWHDDH